MNLQRFFCPNVWSLGGERIGQLPLRYDQVQIKAFFLSFSWKEHSAGMPYKLFLPKKIAVQGFME